MVFQKEYGERKDKHYSFVHLTNIETSILGLQQ